MLIFNANVTINFSTDKFFHYFYVRFNILYNVNLNLIHIRNCAIFLVARLMRINLIICMRRLDRGTWGAGGLAV